MLIVRKSFDRNLKQWKHYPDLAASFNDYHVLMMISDKWTYGGTVHDDEDPGWSSPDLLSLNIPGSVKPPMRLVECWSGVVVAATEKSDQERLKISGLQEVKSFYEMYDGLCLKSIKVRMERLTERVFGKYLTAANEANNRSRRGSRIAYLINEMLKCRFWPGDSAIIEDVLGNQVNGCHRVFMAREAGWPGGVVIYATGWPVVAALAFDSGLGRSTKDNLHFKCKLTMHRMFVGAINYSAGWVWRPEGTRPRAVSLPEAWGWYCDQKAAYRHMIMSRGRQLSAPVAAAFADISTMTGDPRVMEMFDHYRDHAHEAKVGSAVWALVKCMPEITVLTNGDNKSGLTLQKHRYDMTATAIFSYLDNDSKHWDCGEMLRDHLHTRESLTLAIKRFQVKGHKRSPVMMVQQPCLAS